MHTSLCLALSELVKCSYVFSKRRALIEMTENALWYIVQANMLQVFNLGKKTEADICEDPEDEFDIFCWFGRMRSNLV